MDNVITKIIDSIKREDGADERRVITEAIQQVALAGLHRAGFFSKAAFYGGTCLRIFHNLDRFSEDLDFSLLAEEEKFDLGVYLDTVRREFSAYGIEVDFERKQKTAQTIIQSAFLKSNTEIWDISPKIHGNIKVKVEVDIMPPLGFSTEPKMLLLPYTFYTPCFVLPDLFAGKASALLFRKWKTRVKGRDWYDFEWYIRNNIPMNLAHFNIRMLQSEKDRTAFTKDEFLHALIEKINVLDVDQMRNEVRPFVHNTEALTIWSRDYFIELAGRLRLI